MQVRRDGDAFKDYEEGDLSFWPTYKYDTWSDEYDTSKKKRIPSWTDRVLWRCQRSDMIRLLRYDRAGSIKSSDHRPVFAHFTVAVDFGGKVEEKQPTADEKASKACTIL